MFSPARREQVSNFLRGPWRVLLRTGPERRPADTIFQTSAFSWT